MSGKEHRLSLFIIVFIILIANSISAQCSYIFVQNNEEVEVPYTEQTSADPGCFSVKIKRIRY